MDIDSAQGKQVLDNIAISFGGSVSQDPPSSLLPLILKETDRRREGGFYLKRPRYVRSSSCIGETSLYVISPCLASRGDPPKTF